MPATTKDLQNGVSVLMTTYNAMPYLPAAVDSILSQTFTDFELIIVNDGSTDEATRSYLDGLNDPRVKVIHQDNRGTAVASNLGLQHCRRKYIARMDADDVSLPARLQAQYDFMEANPDVAMAGSQLRVLGEKKTGFQVHMPLDHAAIYQALVSLNHGICHGTSVFRNQLARELGGYWDVHGHHDDLDLTLRMADKGRLANLPNVLYLYRVRQDSLVGTRLPEIRKYFYYTVDCARRRREGLAQQSPDTFFKRWEQRPWHQKAREAMDVQALEQYRLATVDICAGRPCRGYLRLAWSALCSPSRTLNRLSRIIAGARVKQADPSEPVGENYVSVVHSHSR
jgi:glycosyltransferase involved in cell wall biosynthesis